MKDRIKKILDGSGYNLDFEVNEGNKFERYFNIYVGFEDVLDDRVFIKVLNLVQRIYENDGKWFDDIKDYLDEVYGDLVNRLDLGKDIIDGFEKYKDIDKDRFKLLGGNIEDRNKEGDEWKEGLLSNDEENFLLLLDDLNEGINDFDDWKLLFSSIRNKDLYDFLIRLDIDKIEFNDSDDLKTKWEEKYVKKIKGGKLISYKDMSNDYLKGRLERLME